MPVDFAEMHGDPLSDDKLAQLRNEMLELKNKLLNSEGKLANLFKNFYPADLSLSAFCHFITFLTIVQDCKAEAKKYLPHLAKIKTVSAESIDTLEKYVSDCTQLRSTWLGYIFKGGKVATLNEELAQKRPHTFEKPQNQLPVLKMIINVGAVPDN